MSYLKNVASDGKMADMIRILIFDDAEMYENTMDDIVKRLSNIFKDEQYLSRVSGSRQRWIDNDIHEITKGLISYLENIVI